MDISCSAGESLVSCTVISDRTEEAVRVKASSANKQTDETITLIVAKYITIDFLFYKYILPPRVN